jgi:hypothetical protein
MFRLENGGIRFFSKCWCLYVSTIPHIMTVKIFIIMRVLPVLGFFLVRDILLGSETLLQFRIWIQECTFELCTERFKSHFTLDV